MVPGCLNFLLAYAIPPPSTCILVPEGSRAGAVEAGVDAKSWPLYTGAESNLRDTVWSEVEKNSFRVLPGKGGHSSFVPSKTVCLHPRGIGEEFYSHGSRVGFLIRI